MDVRYNRMYLRSQRTKWGNCSTLRNLSFNWRLVMAPPSVLDYIVVHGLAASESHPRSTRCWLIVQSHCPDCAASRRWLASHQEEILAALSLNWKGYLAEAPVFRARHFETLSHRFVATSFSPTPTAPAAPRLAGRPTQDSAGQPARLPEAASAERIRPRDEKTRRTGTPADAGGSGWHPSARLLAPIRLIAHAPNPPIRWHTHRPASSKPGKKGDCSTISAGRAEAQGLFPRVFPRFRGRTVLTALIVTWQPRIRCERRRIHGEEAQADPIGCTDDATVSKKAGFRSRRSACQPPRCRGTHTDTLLPYSAHGAARHVCGAEGSRCQTSTLFLPGPGPDRGRTKVGE